MKGFRQCINCDEYTGGNKFCSNRCRLEYHNMNIRMSKQALEVLRVLDERRAWVSMEYTATIASLSLSRNAPLVATRNVTRWTCEAHILPKGEQWLQYHMEARAA